MELNERLYRIFISTTFRLCRAAGMLGILGPMEGEVIDVKEWLYGVSKSTTVPLSEMAEMLGVSKQRLDVMLKTRMFRANRFFELMDKMNVKVTYEFTGQKYDMDEVVRNLIEKNETCESMLWLFDTLGIKMKLIRENGMPIDVYTHGYGYPVITSKKCEDGKVRQIYTTRSELLLTSFYLDGKHEFEDTGVAREIYMDKKGRYFMVIYYDIPGKNPRVTFLNQSDIDTLSKKLNGPEYAQKMREEHGGLEDKRKKKPEEKSETGDKDNGDYTEEFIEWWDVYPRSNVKRTTFERYQMLIKEGWTHEELLEAATAYRKYCEENELRKDQIMYGSMFLNRDCFFKKYLPNADKRWEERM